MLLRNPPPDLTEIVEKNVPKFLRRFHECHVCGGEKPDKKVKVIKTLAFMGEKAYTRRKVYAHDSCLRVPLRPSYSGMPGRLHTPRDIAGYYPFIRERGDWDYDLDVPIARNRGPVKPISKWSILGARFSNYWMAIRDGFSRTDLGRGIRYMQKQGLFNYVPGRRRYRRNNR
jgi:hypothetical protein